MFLLKTWRIQFRMKPTHTSAGYKCVSVCVSAEKNTWKWNTERKKSTRQTVRISSNIHDHMGARVYAPNLRNSYSVGVNAAKPHVQTLSPLFSLHSANEFFACNIFRPVKIGGMKREIIWRNQHQQRFNHSHLHLNGKLKVTWFQLWNSCSIKAIKCIPKAFRPFFCVSYELKYCVTDVFFCFVLQELQSIGIAKQLNFTRADQQLKQNNCVK